MNWNHFVLVLSKTLKSRIWTFDTRRKNISRTAKSFDSILSCRTFTFSARSFVQWTKTCNNSCFWYNSRVQNDFFTSYDNSESDDKVFDGDPFCNEDDDQWKMFDNDLYKSTVADSHYHQPRPKFVSENLYCKSRYSRLRPWNKFPKKFVFPDSDTVYDSPTSVANHSKYSLHFKQPQTGSGNARTK